MPWDNTVLHHVMPVAVLVDWLLSGSAAAVPYRHAYPFLDPSLHGYVGVLGTSVVIAVVLAPLTWVVASAPRWVPATA